MRRKLQSNHGIDTKRIAAEIVAAIFCKKTGTKYAIHSTLITTYGVENNAYSGEIQSIITSDDLFG